MQSYTCVLFSYSRYKWGLRLFSSVKKKRTPKKTSRPVHKKPNEKVDSDVSSPELNMASEGDKMKLGEASPQISNRF